MSTAQSTVRVATPDNRFDGQTVLHVLSSDAEGAQEVAIDILEQRGVVHGAILSICRTHRWSPS